METLAPWTHLSPPTSTGALGHRTLHVDGYFRATGISAYDPEQPVKTLDAALTAIPGNIKPAVWYLAVLFLLDRQF